MPICGHQCGCALQSTTLTISGSGTPEDPWLLDIAELNDVAELQAAVSAINATLATLAATYVNTTGDTMTGVLSINPTGTVSLRLRNSNDTPLIEFRSADNATRFAYIHGINNVSPPMLRLCADPGSVLTLRAGNNDRMRIDTSGDIQFGKTGSDINIGGVEITTTGRVWSTCAAGTDQNIVLNLTGSSAAIGKQFANFRRIGAGVGSIALATTTTVAYNTASDEDLKENVAEVDDELALYWLRITQPLLFNFKATPVDPAGPTTVGYVAQRLAAAWPEAIEYGVVTPGSGDISQRTWDRNGNETTPEGVWQPWQIDYGKLTPFLHSALQALDRQVQDLTARVEALETRPH